MLHVRLEEPEWDIAETEKLRKILAPAAGEPHVVLDLSRVTFIDSSALSVMVQLYQQRVSDRGFAPSHLVVSSHGVRRVLGVAGFEKLWELHDSLDEALAAARNDEIGGAGPNLG
jgi:anti-sigma B factor antagonist